jgi:murein tripeptide amidase MpaA
MPLGGRWEKEGEEWKIIGEEEVETEKISLLGREKIAELCRKKFQVPKKVYSVDIPKYHTHTKLKEEIAALSAEFSEIAVQYTIGQSVGERDLICLKISEDATKERTLLKPQVKYIANIHGDEVVGRELLLALARALCEQFGHDTAITNILETVEIHFLFSMNPDGFVLKTRNNANDKDLNRGFPDWADLGPKESGVMEGREPEVSAVMKWISSNSFLISLSFHDGWTMIIFPWDDSPGCTPQDNAVCSEDNVFYALAQTYAYNHKFMHTG